jgi:hypothetical protein
VGRDVRIFYKDPALAEEKMDFIQLASTANAYEAVIMTRSGGELTLVVNKAPLWDSSGRLLGFRRDQPGHHRAQAGRRTDSRASVTGFRQQPDQRPEGPDPDTAGRSDDRRFSGGPA